MLESFIKEYKECYEHSFSSGFRGEFERFCAFLLDPAHLPSVELKARLNALNALFYEPLEVAVVGQFSSGKSSLLNAILGADILPTGVVPVTAKPTFIKYAPQSMLKALYKDGREEFLPVSELSAFVDQRGDLKDVEALYIYADKDILKQISFIDTPGLNSLSANDTKETLKILRKASGLIWLSLIDNAGRAGELEELALVPKELKEHAICLLNQKDKLNDEEIARVLAHSKITYDDYFKEVLPISAKLARQGVCGSGFEELKDFLASFDKDEYIKANLIAINKSMIAQQERVLAILEHICSIFYNFEAKVNESFVSLEKNYKKSFELIYEDLKQNAALIAKQILSYVSVKKCEYFKAKKGTFGSVKFEPASYEAWVLDEGSALSNMLYNDDKLSRLFVKMRRDFNELNQKIKADLSELFEGLKDEALSFKAKYESLRKHDFLHSDTLHANIRQFSCDAWALFFASYERELEGKFARLDLFFERINIKISTNYANALRLTLAHISEKIAKQRASFESDPLSFSLYCPNERETCDRLLNELSYYEFENEIIGATPFITKFLLGIKDNFSKIKEDNLERINHIKTRHQKELEELENLAKF